MCSISTDQRIPIASSMPGRYKSCRRSTSDLFTKEQEQELRQCAQSEVVMRVEQGREQESPVKMTEVSSPKLSPTKLTPLRWRSTSMKGINGSLDVAGSTAPAEKSIETEPVAAQPVEEMRLSQSAKRPSQAQLRAKVMNSLSLEQVSNVQAAEPLDHAEPVELSNLADGSEHVLVKERSLNSAMSVERACSMERRELFPEDPANQNKCESRGISVENDCKGAMKKPNKPVPITVEPVEEIVFQPVDLDKKYRQKELVRHVTAAKIQNREEAILNNSSPPGQNSRKVPVGEEPAAMTIEFLRARLQAERSASKATKLRMEQLSKKVVDLESRLLTEVGLRKSAETSLQDALLKLKQAAPQSDQGIQQEGPSHSSGSLKVADAGSLKDVKTTVSRVDVEPTVEISHPVKKEKDLVGHEEGSSKLVGDIEQSSTNQDASCSIAENKEGLWRDRSVSAHNSLKAGSLDGEDPESTVKVVVPDSGSGSSPERVLTPSRQKQETRAAIEERLRSMWSKIGEEMAALAEVRGEEELVKKDLGQLPFAVQDKHSSGDSGAKNSQQVDVSEAHLTASNQQTEETYGSRNVRLDEVLNGVTSAAEKRSSFKRNAALAKNVAKLVEQFEFQETAQREWEENFEAQQSLEQNEVELPALVTRDGDVVTERGADPRGRGGIARSQSHGERNPNVHGGHISRSKSLGLLPSQQGVTSGSVSRKGSSNGRIDILEGNRIEEIGGDDELLYDPETEVAEELPNGIYLHHSRAEVDPYARAVNDVVYRKGIDRVVGSIDINSPSRLDRAPHGRERFPRKADLQEEVDQRGWPVREVQDRASRDMYYEPIINNRGVRVDAPYSTSDREFLQRSKTIPERVSDDIYRGGSRWDGPGTDRVQRQDERRMPATLYSHTSGEEATGMPYGYPDRDHLEQDVSYRGVNYRHREDGHRGMPVWQEAGDPGFRNRGMNHNSYGYPPPYGMEEQQQTQYPQAGVYADTVGYNGHGEMSYMSHGTHHSRPDYYSPGGMPGPKPPMKGHAPPERPPVTQGHAVWESVGVQEESNAPVSNAPVSNSPVSNAPVSNSPVSNAPVSNSPVSNAPVGVSEDAPQVGEAGEVLKALRIAKQQIKSSTVEQAAFMTAQYTVSQEHRYGAGGQVSKTSYTVEAPVGYPRVTKTIHEGWHLDGGKPSLKKRGGLHGSKGVAIDLTGTNVTDLINSNGPLPVNGAESSYVEKLNVGRGIQFFFSG